MLNEMKSASRGSNEMKSVPSGKSVFGGIRFTLFFVLCVCSATLFSQSITNKLGASGLFIIKDGSNNYLTLDQSTGQMNILRTLRLENTSDSSLGVIFKGADRFIHNYGLFNTFIGINAGNFTMTGYDNTGLGWNSLNSNTAGYRNTALGLSSLYSNTTGYDNTAVGLNSLAFNTTGLDNTAMGSYSLFSNTIGDDNTAVGIASLYSNTSGYNNTAMGSYSLYSNTTGYHNIALGYHSLYSNTTGHVNTALGYHSLYSNIIGDVNTAVGYQSLYSNTIGDVNTAVGNASLYSNTTGSYNTAFGYNAGSSITTGINNTCIGYDSQPTSGDATNQITLGDGSITSLRCAVTTITSLSDARDKRNIKDLNLGIDFLMKIKPRIFNWDKREWYENNISDGSKMKEEPTAGFIAQELDEVQTTQNSEWLNLVLKDNPEKLEATPGNLLPIMVKAIQDLKKENDELKKEVESLKSMSEKLVTLEQLVNELTSINQTSFSSTNKKEK